MGFRLSTYQHSASIPRYLAFEIGYLLYAFWQLLTSFSIDLLVIFILIYYLMGDIFDMPSASDVPAWPEIILWACRPLAMHFNRNEIEARKNDFQFPPPTFLIDRTVFSGDCEPNARSLRIGSHGPRLALSHISDAK